MVHFHNYMVLEKFEGSTGWIDLDFIFMFRVIGFRNEDKNDDSVVFYSRAMVRHSVGWNLYNKSSLYL